MRGTFFLYLAVMLLALLLLYGIWVVLAAFWTMWREARSNRELDQLAVAYAERRARRREEDASRLNNGCQHEYGHVLGALPEDVCCKCGLARQRPEGGCDHVWRICPGAVPESQCELCGKRYSTAAAH